MCLAAVSVSVTVSLELELLSSVEEDSDPAADDGRGGSRITGKGGESVGMTVSSSSSRATDITLFRHKGEGVLAKQTLHAALHTLTDTIIYYYKHKSFQIQTVLF